MLGRVSLNQDNVPVKKMTCRQRAKRSVLERDGDGAQAPALEEDGCKAAARLAPAPRRRLTLRGAEDEAEKAEGSRERERPREAGLTAVFLPIFRRERGSRGNVTIYVDRCVCVWGGSKVWGQNGKQRERDEEKDVGGQRFVVLEAPTCSISNYTVL